MGNTEGAAGVIVTCKRKYLKVNTYYVLDHGMHNRIFVMPQVRQHPGLCDIYSRYVM